MIGLQAEDQGPTHRPRDGKTIDLAALVIRTMSVPLAQGFAPALWNICTDTESCKVFTPPASVASALYVVEGVDPQ